MDYKGGTEMLIGIDDDPKDNLGLSCLIKYYLNNTNTDHDLRF